MTINKLGFILFLFGAYMCGAAQGVTLGPDTSVGGFITVGFLFFICALIVQLNEKK